MESIVGNRVSAAYRMARRCLVGQCLQAALICLVLRGRWCCIVVRGGLISPLAPRKHRPPDDEHQNHQSRQRFKQNQNHELTLLRLVAMALIVGTLAACSTPPPRGPTMGRRPRPTAPAPTAWPGDTGPLPQPLVQPKAAGCRCAGQNCPGSPRTHCTRPGTPGSGVVSGPCPVYRLVWRCAQAQHRYVRGTARLDGGAPAALPGRGAGRQRRRPADGLL